MSPYDTTSDNMQPPSYGVFSMEAEFEWSACQAGAQVMRSCSFRRRYTHYVRDSESTRARCNRTTVIQKVISLRTPKFSSLSARVERLSKVGHEPGASPCPHRRESSRGRSSQPTTQRAHRIFPRCCNSSGDLRGHLERVSHTAARYPCLGCGSGPYTRGDALRRHMKSWREELLSDSRSNCRRCWSHAIEPHLHRCRSLTRDKM
jgi:hypothetical protein